MSCGGSHTTNKNAAEISRIAKEAGLPVKTVAENFHGLISDRKVELGIPAKGGSSDQQQEVEAWARQRLLQAVSEKERCDACGQFSTEGHSCPPEKLREYAIAEDTQSAKWYEECALANQKRLMMAENLHHMNGEKREYGYNGRGEYKNNINDTIFELQGRIREAEEDNDSLIRGTSSYARVSEVKEYLARYDAQAQEVARLSGLLEEADDRYEKYGWNRAFLVVTSGQGHVHRSMDCSTCYATTKFNWLPSYSGSSESQIVEDAGERACSVCYPSAPVETFSKPTKIYSDDEKQAAIAKAAKAEEKIVKQAAKIAKAATKDGSELTVVTERGVTPSHLKNAGQPYSRKEHFKTERSAVMWATDALAGFYRQPNETELEAVDAIVASLAEKHGKPETEIRADIDKKAAAKAKKYS